jgi:hypothetical protein
MAKEKEVKTEEPIVEENKVEETPLGEPIGILFDTMNYYKNEDLDRFISNLNQEQALYCILQACQSAFKRNAYNITETELLSKAIRVVSSPTN